MLKLFLFFLAGYIILKFLQIKKLLFGFGLSKKKERKSVPGIRNEDIREAEFKDIKKEDF